MPVPPSKESLRVRERIVEILTSTPEGMSPFLLTQAIYGNKVSSDSDDTESRALRSRVQYQLTTLLKTKQVTQSGYAKASVYKVNTKRPSPDVADLPAATERTKRVYTRRGSKSKPEEPSTNGAMSNPQRELIAYVVADIRGKLTKLEELLH